MFCFLYLYFVPVVVVVGVTVVAVVGVMFLFEKRFLSVIEVGMECLGVSFGLVGGDISILISSTWVKILLRWWRRRRCMMWSWR